MGGLPRLPGPAPGGARSVSGKLTDAIVSWRWSHMASSARGLLGALGSGPPPCAVPLRRGSPLAAPPDRRLEGRFPRQALGERLLRAGVAARPEPADLEGQLTLEAQDGLRGRLLERILE